MKSFSGIFLFAASMFSSNLLKAQLIIINSHGRLENRDVEIAQIKNRSVGTGSSMARVVTKRFYRPLKDLKYTSGYGWRTHPVTGNSKFHSGIDLKAWYEPVYAVADGIVTKAGWGNAEGFYVVINHGGAETIYCHLSKLLCSQGNTLSGGTVLGISGNTGRSTGPHLHFGLKYDNEHVDPANLLKVIAL